MSADQEALLGLLARVRSAGALDPDLDRDLAVHLRGWCTHERTTREGYQDDTGFVCDDCGADSWGNKNDAGQRLHERAPEVTTSVDAALALAESVQPKRWPDILRAAISHLGQRHDWHICFPREGQRDQLPLAIVRATLIAALAHPTQTSEADR